MRELDFDVLRNRVLDSFEDAIEKYVKEADTDELADLCEEIDSYNGFLDSDRIYPMETIDGFINTTNCSVLEIYDSFADGFNSNADYFTDTPYGFQSTNIRDYADIIGESEIIRQIINEYERICLGNDELDVIFDNRDCANGLIDTLEDLADDDVEENAEEIEATLDELRKYILI